MTANEIRKGDFVYRDILFVDPGGDKRHPRASVAELKDLLLPKKGHTVPKDQVGHWYEAQLLHYGLPRTKDKNTVKVRLTSAIGAGSLAVPTHISQLEADMKKEFAAANRKAKAAAKQTQAADSLNETASAGKKRKRGSDNATQASASTTKMSVTVGNVTFDINHSENGVNNPKKRKTASLPTKASSDKATTTVKKEKKSAATSKQPTSKATPSKKPAITSASQSSARGTTAKRGAKTSATKSSAGQSPKQQTGKKGKIPAKTSKSRASPLPSTKQEDGVPQLDDQNDEDIKMEDAPPLDEFPKIDQKPSKRKDDKGAAARQFEGKYYINSEWGMGDAEITLVQDPETTQFWAHFAVDEYDGILSIPGNEKMTTKREIEFDWRAENVVISGVHYDRDGGWIEFDGKGGIKGCFRGILPEGKVCWTTRIKFYGTRVKTRKSDVKVQVQDLISRWEYYGRVYEGL